MAHEPIRSCVDDVVASLFHHPVRPKTARVNARAPGEQERGGRQCDQCPAHYIAKLPKPRLRVVVVARWKRKEKNHAGVKKKAEKKLGRYGVSLLGLIGPKHRDDP
jgi:hypothetical protein